ncbi:polysaccharide deacetylase family protein [Fibrobacter sp. UWB11]|uniref:polysaccharide deacetylase family protein n=1 Tax=Fibrobacter sp. UWB11 TaxID=1896202 RepID=UPI0009260487|nr:polysaccharide deacetylase family protein [Fibrobacter sp. UWB11]SIO29002.1 Polysaccharide deacetylase [Fibrobacter sp. UWB11]
MYCKTKNKSSKIALACVFAFGLIGYCTAAPVKTVPWNGHVGAVSFTFDDALETQVLNLKPLLDAMPDVHVTFFLTAFQDRLNENAAGFAALAIAGHEIGNHTISHWHLPQETDEELEEDVVKFADTIEATLAKHGADVQVISFATPFCENDDHVKTIIEKRHLINRDCTYDGARTKWNEEPDWMSMPAKIWSRSGATVNEMLNALDTAAFIGNYANANPLDPQITEGTWLIVLQHDVSERLIDNYAINPDDIKALFERAVRNKLWVAPIGTVGAYQRAHFVFDNALMTKTDDGYSVKWKIPNERMPKSVPLRVRIDTTRVSSKTIIEQDGKVLTPESDGSYIIEFMSKSLILKNTGEVSIPKAIKATQNKQAYKYTLFDIKGHKLEKINDFAVPERYPKGVYFIRAEANGMPTITRKVAR